MKNENEYTQNNFYREGTTISGNLHQQVKSHHTQGSEAKSYGFSKSPHSITVIQFALVMTGKAHTGELLLSVNLQILECFQMNSKCS